ncbi:MAG TPA: CDP-alcohol phosphatidyltransferase family protein [Allosphingosinicella sp.]|nr:CDP-alcohol phosphatidyltransferase family protein [Allosphingosinicella sp.]
MTARPRPAWLPPPDGSRDLRVEDPTNQRVVHLAARMLLPLALRARIPANAVSIAGLAVGTGAALAYLGWRDPALATFAFLLSVGWLILDGLDGMIARATGTASALGRLLDGLCDHGVFLLLYLALGASIGTAEAWITGSLAGLVHGVQANFYEGERARYHRRLRGDPGAEAQPISPHWLVRGYDRMAGALDRLAAPCDRALAGAADRRAFAAAYAERAAPALKLMNLLNANWRVIAIYAACLAGDPRLFWWWELGPLTALTLAGIAWHRRAERRLVAGLDR